MEFFDDEFQFILELIIISRNENGATLKEIHDDFYNLFGVNFEEIWGYKYADQHINYLLTNVMLHVSTKKLKSGCVLYYYNYYNIERVIAKLAECSESIGFICDELNINVEKLREDHKALMRSQSRMRRSQAQSTNRNKDEKTVNKKSVRHRVSHDCVLHGHSIIGDDFFLEIANIDLKYYKNMKNKVHQIGQCISGQTIKTAVKNLPSNINKIKDNVIINLGSLDLMQGRELIDMMEDTNILIWTLVKQNKFPIITTLPPLANHMHNKELERRRKAYNEFLRNTFDSIDIDHCFLSTVGRIMFDLYQPGPKLVTGSRHPFVIWNRVGRQRVVKMLKRKIPEIYDEICY